MNSVLYTIDGRPEANRAGVQAALQSVTSTEREARRLSARARRAWTCVTPPRVVDGQQPASRARRAADVATPITVEFFDDFMEVSLTRAVWDAFVDANGGDVFCSFAWCSAWWRHFGCDRELLLGIARRGGELVAILPLFADTIRIGRCAVSVIRLVGSDYGVTPCGYVVADDARDAVAEAVACALDGLSDWDMVYLGELPAYQDCVDPIVRALKGRFGETQVSYRPSFYPQMVFSVPTTFDEYVGSLSARERNNLLRDSRKSKTVEVHANCNDGDEITIRRDLRRLFALHAEQWRAHGRLGHAGDWPGWEDFLGDVACESAKSGNLVLTASRVDEEVVASELALRFGRRAHWIIGGRTVETSSRVGFARVMQAAIDANVVVVDALGGEFAYKRRLGADQVGLKTITVIRPCARSMGRVDAMRHRVRLVDAFYFRTWTWRIAPALRRCWQWGGMRLAGRGYWQTFMRARFLGGGHENIFASQGASE